MFKTKHAFIATFVYLFRSCVLFAFRFVSFRFNRVPLLATYTHLFELQLQLQL